MLLFASPQVGVPHVSRFSKRGRHCRLQRSDGSHRELRLGPILQLARPRFAESIRPILGAGDISGDDTTPRLNSGLVQTKLQMEGLVGLSGRFSNFCRLRRRANVPVWAACRIRNTRKCLNSGCFRLYRSLEWRCRVHCLSSLRVF